MSKRRDWGHDEVELWKRVVVVGVQDGGDGSGEWAIRIADAVVAAYRERVGKAEVGE